MTDTFEDLFAEAEQNLWGAKTRFTPRDLIDLQAERSADAPHG
jgi:hypothetical protein